jgi:hypothetical protein
VSNRTSHEEGATTNDGFQRASFPALESAVKKRHGYSLGKLKGYPFFSFVDKTLAPRYAGT